MAYATGNPKTKAELKRRVAAGEKVGVFQPGPLGPHVSDGRVAIEGPHFPEPHRWYASCVVEHGVIVSVK